jgi:hypothetical protein
MNAAAARCSPYEHHDPPPAVPGPDGGATEPPDQDGPAVAGYEDGSTFASSI